MRLPSALLPSLFLTAAVLAWPARANDSEAAINLGGIELVQNPHISMDSEDLYISQQEVRVRYRYTNHSSKDQELTISFPLPAIKAAEEEFYSDQSVPDFTKLEFQTTVNGKPVKFQTLKRAEVKGKDVTQRLTQLGWPLEWITGTGDEPRFIRKLTPAQLQAGVSEGLLRREDHGMHFPTWDVVTHVTRKQLFLAGKTVEVTHRYAPMLGGSVAGSLYPAVREEFSGTIKQYCIDKTFLTAFDKKVAVQLKNPDAPMAYSETWIGYVLSSGRNWRGPIKDFRLVIDKGKPENMVSFCMSGVKKISPTQFEVRRKNFEPKGDLEILIVKWPSISD
jgi:hypothetical protein